MVRLLRSRRVRIALWTGLTLMLLAGLVPVLSHWWVERTTQAYIYTEIAQLPAKQVGLLLGTNPILGDGRPNRYFRFRMDATADLYKAGKIHHILASGDNSRQDYDEPNEMALALVQRGVPASAISLDYAGFRTLDSIIRAKEVFGQDHLTIISQPDHARRAVYIARHLGLDAVAFCAKDLQFGVALKTQLREYLAQAKVLLDLHVLRTKPKFLGPHVSIGE